MIIMNGHFEHNDIHKYTWECRGRGLRTIIDYFAVRKSLRPAVADVKVIRGAEAGSDHYLVLMKANLRWGQQKKVIRNEGNRLRLRKLRDLGVRVRFQAELGMLYKKASGCGVEGIQMGNLSSDREGSRQTQSSQAVKVTSWWNNDVKEAVKKKNAYAGKPLNDKTVQSWKLYKEAKKFAKQVVWIAKEKDLVTEGRCCKGTTLVTEGGFGGSTSVNCFSVKERSVEKGPRKIRIVSNELDDSILMEETRRVIGKLKSGKAGGVCDIRGENAEGRRRSNSTVANGDSQCSVEDKGDTKRMKESYHYPNLQERHQKSLQELQRDQSAECAGKGFWEDLE